MPKQVDRAQRRGEITSALWRVVTRDGIDAATVRNVAAEAGVSTGRVQHYFSTKEEMLRFALHQVGDQLAARLSERVAALPHPCKTRDVVRVVLAERLPLDPERRVYVHAMVAWLGQAHTDPQLAEYMASGHRTLRDYLVDQLRHAQQAGQARAGAHPVRTADGLLALADGLTSHVLQGIHDPADALAVLDERLDQIFTDPPTDNHHPRPITDGRTPRRSTLACLPLPPTPVPIPDP